MAAIDEDDGAWHEIGKLFDSDYGPWGVEKRMYNPFILHAKDGTWRAVFQVNDIAPCFAAVYSDDLITWRPQDYPRMSAAGCFSPVIRETSNGFDVFFTSSKKGKRVTSATHDFRHFTADRQASDDINVKRDQAIVDGTMREGQLISVSDEEAQRLMDWHAQQRSNAELYKETLREDGEKLLPLLQPENGALTATLYAYPDQEKASATN